MDSRPIPATTILNGAFSTILSTPGVLVDFQSKQVNYWGDADQKPDFTPLDNGAEFTALPVLRIAGGEASARDIAAIATQVIGEPFALNRSGSLDDLASTITTLRQESEE